MYWRNISTCGFMGQGCNVRTLYLWQNKTERNKMILTITNQKGGIGKSTSSQNIGAGLAKRGYKTLLIDLDAQANLTLSTGLQNADIAGTAFELLQDKSDIKAVDCIAELKENLYIIPASLKLSQADLLITGIGKEMRLKKALEPIKDKFDFIVIDTPPSLGILTVNALTTADKVILPAQADLFSLEAIKQLYGNLQLVKEYYNPDLKIEGILLTRYASRNILTQNLTDQFKHIAESIQTKVFENSIREAIAIKESQTCRKDIFEYAPESNVALDYLGVVDEIIKDSIRG